MKSLHHHFQLFIAGNEPNSKKALEVIKRLGEIHLQGNYTLEVVDVLKNYQEALKNNIFLAPTLIIKSPLPETRIAGSLSDIRKLHEILGLLKDEEGI